MSASLTCFFGLIIWAFILLFVVLASRLTAVIKTGHDPFFFQQDGSDLSAGAQRITRAERNNLEWLVLPVGLLLYGIATGQSAITDGLALWVLGARIAQTLFHMSSGSGPVTLIRANLFGAQFIIYIIWTMKFIGAAS